MKRREQLKDDEQRGNGIRRQEKRERERRKQLNVPLDKWRSWMFSKRGSFICIHDGYPLGSTGCCYCCKEVVVSVVHVATLHNPIIKK